MNEKEARDIVADPTKLNVSMYDYREAKGYLEALAKVNVLEKAFDDVGHYTSAPCLDLVGEYALNDRLRDSAIISKAQAEWREVK